MAIEPLQVLPRLPEYRLVPLDRARAGQIAAWPRSAGEAYWLAPRTTPPLTGEKILSWASPGRQQLMLCECDTLVAVAYGEMNVLNADAAEYWLGHLIVDPQRRGRGLGTMLTRLLVQRAFMTLGARRITLVVFPENQAAIRCYEEVGFRADGFEMHYFPIYMRRARLVRMALHA